MKTTFALSLLLSVLFISCKKDDLAPVDNSSGFGFTVLNGRNYNWNFTPDSTDAGTGAFFARVEESSVTHQPIYMLKARDTAINTWVQLALYTNVLSEGTYRHVTTLADPYVESIVSLYGDRYFATNDDYVEVVVTKVEGNYISGTFSSVMHDYSENLDLKLTIVNGYFKKIFVTH